MRNARSLFGGITACPRSHRTAAAGRLFLTCCLMTSGGSWLVGWKSWFNVTGSAAPPVMLNISTFMIKLNFYAYGLFRKIMEFDCSHLRICMEEEPECMGEYFCFQNYSSFLLTFLVLFLSLVPSLCYPSFLPSSFLCFSKISAINLRNMGNFCIYYFHMTKLQSWVWKTREFLKVTCWSPIYMFMNINVDMFLADDETLSGSLSPVLPDALNSFMLLSSLPAALPKLGQSRVPPLMSGQQLQVSGLRRSRHQRLLIS